jgi:hypothetical protein
MVNENKPLKSPSEDRVLSTCVATSSTVPKTGMETFFFVLYCQNFLHLINYLNK